MKLTLIIKILVKKEVVVVAVLKPKNLLTTCRTTKLKLKSASLRILEVKTIIICKISTRKNKNNRLLLQMTSVKRNKYIVVSLTMTIWHQKVRHSNNISNVSKKLISQLKLRIIYKM